MWLEGVRRSPAHAQAHLVQSRLVDNVFEKLSGGEDTPCVLKTKFSTVAGGLGSTFLPRPASGLSWHLGVC